MISHQEQSARDRHPRGQSRHRCGCSDHSTRCTLDPFGRPARFDEVVDRSRDRLLRVAQRITKNPELAEDAVQEALICLWSCEDWPEHVDQWLNRAVTYRSLHLCRSKRRQGYHESRAGSERYFDGSRLDFDHDLAERELRDIVWQALGELPDPYRIVFELRVVGHAEYAEIAARLGIPIGTVRSRLNRCRKLLQVALAQRGFAPPRSEAFKQNPVWSE